MSSTNRLFHCIPLFIVARHVRHFMLRLKPAQLIFSQITYLSANNLSSLSSLTRHILKHNALIIVGDMNAQIGKHENNKLAYTSK